MATCQYYHTLTSSVDQHDNLLAGKKYWKVFGFHPAVICSSPDRGLQNEELMEAGFQ